MVDLKKHNEEETEETNNDNIAFLDDCYYKKAITIIRSAILVLLCFLFGSRMIIKIINMIDTNSPQAEAVPYVPEEEVFSLTVTGKSGNTVSEVFVMEFTDNKGTSRSFTVPKKLFDEYEIGNQVDITVDYQKEAFVLDDEKIEEIK